MPIALRGPRKAMRGKCERGRGGCGSHSAEGRILRGRHRRACGGSVNAGAEVQTRTGRVRKSSRAMGTRRRRLSAPWLQFHGADRADVYIIIHVRACCCGECALNPPTSPPIPRRRPSLAPAAPTHARRLRDTRPADLTTHSPPKTFARPRTATRPSRALPLPHEPRRMPAGCEMHSPPTSQHLPRRRLLLAPAQRHALAEHLRSPTQPRRTPTQRRRTPAGCAMHSPPTAQPIPRRRPSPTPAQQHALPEHFRAPPQRRHTPAGCAMHSPPTAQPIPRTATRCLPFRSASGTKKRHRTVHVRCRMSRSTVVAVGHLGW